LYAVADWDYNEAYITIKPKIILTSNMADVRDLSDVRTILLEDAIPTTASTSKSSNFENSTWGMDFPRNVTDVNATFD